jgi:hypothetical protein
MLTAEPSRRRDGGTSRAALGRVKQRPLLTTLIAVVALALWFSPSAKAAVSGFDSSYAGESAFLTVTPGQTYTFQVFFMNTGATTWRRDTATQVNLGVCLENKVTCNVPSPHGDWNDGSWLSARAYATHTQVEVVPGVVAAFSYRIKVPVGAENGDYRFNGDLALATGQQIHPEGYYQEAGLHGDRGP